MYCVCREEVNEFFGFKDRDFDDCLSFEEFMGEETTLGKKKKQKSSNISLEQWHVLYQSASTVYICTCNQCIKGKKWENLIFMMRWDQAEVDEIKSMGMRSSRVRGWDLADVDEI